MFMMSMTIENGAYGGTWPSMKSSIKTIKWEFICPFEIEFESLEENNLYSQRSPSSNKLIISCIKTSVLSNCGCKILFFGVFEKVEGFYDLSSLMYIAIRYPRRCFIIARKAHLQVHHQIGRDK